MATTEVTNTSTIENIYNQLITIKEKMDSYKKTRPVTANVTLKAKFWYKDSTETYPYYYDLVVKSAGLNDRFEASLKPEYLTKARTMQICPTTEIVEAGKVRIRAGTKPTEDLPLQYWLAKTDTDENAEQ